MQNWVQIRAYKKTQKDAKVEVKKDGKKWQQMAIVHHNWEKNYTEI